MFAPIASRLAVTKIRRWHPSEQLTKAVVSSDGGEGGGSCTDGDAEDDKEHGAMTVEAGHVRVDGRDEEEEEEDLAEAVDAAGGGHDAWSSGEQNVKSTTGLFSLTLTKGVQLR